ncbi:MAG: hypothetical protein V1738_04205 [Patescibacteria group bacterium]
MRTIAFGRSCRIDFWNYRSQIEALTFSASFDNQYLSLRRRTGASHIFLPVWEGEKESKMSGELYVSEQERNPEPGDRVYVVVDDVNEPTGIWFGRLVTVDKLRPAVGRFDTLTEWASCCAVIADPNADPNFDGREPSLNYRVYSVSAGTEHFLRLHRKAQQQILELKKRQEIERQSFHDLMRALSYKDGGKSGLTDAELKESLLKRHRQDDKKS